jgi:hypothetical protein
LHALGVFAGYANDHVDQFVEAEAFALRQGARCKASVFFGITDGDLVRKGMGIEFA